MARIGLSPAYYALSLTGSIIINRQHHGGNGLPFPVCRVLSLHTLLQRDHPFHRSYFTEISFFFHNKADTSSRTLRQAPLSAHVLQDPDIQLSTHVAAETAYPYLAGNS